jgi:hypothetical protein
MGRVSGRVGRDDGPAPVRKRHSKFNGSKEAATRTCGPRGRRDTRARLRVTREQWKAQPLTACCVCLLNCFRAGAVKSGDLLGRARASCSLLSNEQPVDSKNRSKLRWKTNGKTNSSGPKTTFQLASLWR